VNSRDPLRTCLLALLVSVLFAASRSAPAQSVNEYPLPSAPSGNDASEITAGPDGNVWFVERAANKIGFITPAGAITDFALPSAGRQPFGLAAGPDGNLWFTEGAGAVGRITPAGVVTEFPVPTSGGRPEEIVAGPDGNLWFTEFLGNRIGRITPSGSVVEFTVPTAGSQPEGITAGPDGALWFTEFAGNRVGRITTLGTVTEFAVPTPGALPVGIAAGTDGALWFAEVGAGRIGRVTTAGVVSEIALSTSGAAPSGVAVGRDGALWFTEFEGNRIGRITTTGIVSEFPVPTPGSGPNRIAAGPDGSLWFTEALGNRIGRLVPVTVFLLPSSAHAPGAGGAFFTTDLTIANTGTTDATYTLKFLGNNVDGRNGATRSFTLGAGKSVTYRDLLGNVFGLANDFGAVRIASSTPSLALLAQTSTPSGGGTVGQVIPVAVEADLVASRTPRSIVAVRDDDGFRTNLVLANATELPVDVDVAIVSEGGGLLGSGRYSLAPLGMTQATRVVRAIGLTGDVSVVRLVLSTQTPGGAFAAYAALIDNGTNDPRTLLAK
jgi:streptogramin lyase